MSKKKLNRNYPDDQGLKRQLRSPDTRLSAFAVLEKHFFPEKFDADGNRKIVEKPLDKANKHD